jgi:hypothetical protein
MSISVDDEFFGMVTAFCFIKGMNRSAFIRESVRIAMRGVNIDDGKHLFPQQHRDSRDDGKCNQYSNLGRCGICYAEGLE